MPGSLKKTPGLPHIRTRLPGPQAKKVLQEDHTYVSPSYTRSYPLVAKRGRGAVVEGTWNSEGYFKASVIMAKHSEEYKAPHGEDAEAGYKELIKTLKKQSAQ